MSLLERVQLEYISRLATFSHIRLDTLDCVPFVHSQIYVVNSRLHCKSIADDKFHTCLDFYCPAPLASRCYSHGKQETDEEFDARWVTYFNKPDIDAWELRKGMSNKS